MVAGRPKPSAPCCSARPDAVLRPAAAGRRSVRCRAGGPRTLLPFSWGPKDGAETSGSGQCGEPSEVFLASLLSPGRMRSVGRTGNVGNPAKHPSNRPFFSLSLIFGIPPLSSLPPHFFPILYSFSYFPISPHSPSSLFSLRFLLSSFLALRPPIHLLPQGEKVRSALTHSTAPSSATHAISRAARSRNLASRISLPRAASSDLSEYRNSGSA